MTDIKYFTINDAINAPTESNRVFIIANERKKTGEFSDNKKTIGRYYTVFDSFKEFLDNRDDYPHCHEILVDHVNNKSNISGRLVFDFDIKDIDSIPEDDEFKEQVEWVINTVIEEYYTDVDLDRLVFIWSSTYHENKMSKHLTVKNFHFDNWKSMMVLFYGFFSKTWDENYDWITSDKLVDSQIIRKSASLRMVGSRKIDGNVLALDDDSHRFVDSLIRIYFPKHLKAEQTISLENIKEEYIPSVPKELLKEKRTTVRDYIDTPLNYDISEEFSECFKIINLLQPGVFIPYSMRNDTSMTLKRIIPAPCLNSGIVHESENAFIYSEYANIITKTTKIFYFVCYRNCNPKHKRIPVCIRKDIDSCDGYVGENEYADKCGFFKYCIPKALQINLG